MSEISDNAHPPSRPSFRQKLAQLIVGRSNSDDAENGDEPSGLSAIGLRVRELEEATVRDVMTSRVDLAAVEVETSLDEVLKLFVAEAHSRMPVYRGSLDSPLGFIHVKDIVAELVEAGWSSETLASRPLERLSREIMFVPESMPLPDLLQKMQSTRIHMAMVIDEFGGTDGLVCLEDIVEAIVGDLEDEHDNVTPTVQKRGRNIWDVDGLADIEDVEELTGLSLELEEFEDEVDTMGGLVSALAGKVPQASETIIHPSGVIFEVLAADPRRVMRVRIRKDPAAQTAGVPSESPSSQELKQG